MTHSIDDLYGYIFIHKKEIAYNIFNKINPEWNVLTIHKDFYSAIKELVQDNAEIDMITIVEKLRQSNKFKNEYALRISQCTSNAPFVRVDSLLNEIEYKFKLSKLQLLNQQMSTEINGGNTSIDAVIKKCDEIKDVLINNEIETFNNYQTIDNVINKHNLAKSGQSIGINLGWECLHNKILLENVDVMILGGRPAMGKTAWMISAIKKMAFDQNIKIAVFSLEMSNEQIMRRMLSNLTGINSNKIKLGYCNKYELSQIEKCKENPKWENVTFFDGSHSVMDITRELTQLKNTSGVQIYMVDYIQKIIPTKNDSRYQEVTKISNDIKRLTMGLKIPCIALAQLSRDSSKQGKRPSLPDLKESGDLEQDASVVAFLHRAEYYGETEDENGISTEGKGEFLIGKNREGSIGVEKMNVDFTKSEWVDIPFNENIEPIKEIYAKNNTWHQTDENPF